MYKNVLFFDKSVNDIKLNFRRRLALGFVTSTRRESARFDRPFRHLPEAMRVRGGAATATCKLLRDLKCIGMIADEDDALLRRAYTLCQIGGDSIRIGRRGSLWPINDSRSARPTPGRNSAQYSQCLDRHIKRINGIYLIKKDTPTPGTQKESRFDIGITIQAAA